MRFVLSIMAFSQASAALIYGIVPRAVTHSPVRCIVEEAKVCFSGHFEHVAICDRSVENQIVILTHNIINITLRPANRKNAFEAEYAVLWNDRRAQQRFKVGLNFSVIGWSDVSAQRFFKQATVECSRCIQRWRIPRIVEYNRVGHLGGHKSCLMQDEPEAGLDSHTR